MRETNVAVKVRDYSSTIVTNSTVAVKSTPVLRRFRVTIFSSEFNSEFFMNISENVKPLY